MNRMHPVSAAALRSETWANGAGTTTVIDSGPQAANWQWRLSVADISADCTFSAYPNTRRLIVPLDAPLQLCFGDGRKIDLLRLVGTTFDGADAPQAALPEGATRAFNLMLRGDAQAETMARPLNGSMWLPVREQSRWFVYLAAGRAQVWVDDAHAAMEQNESMWIDAQPGERTRIEGGGELVLVQLTVTG